MRKIFVIFALLAGCGEVETADLAGGYGVVWACPEPLCASPPCAYPLADTDTAVITESAVTWGVAAEPTSRATHAGAQHDGCFIVPADADRGAYEICPAGDDLFTRITWGDVTACATLALR